MTVHSDSARQKGNFYGTACEAVKSDSLYEELVTSLFVYATKYALSRHVEFKVFSERENTNAL